MRPPQANDSIFIVGRICNRQNRQDPHGMTPMAEQIRQPIIKLAKQALTDGFSVSFRKRVPGVAAGS